MSAATVVAAVEIVFQNIAAAADGWLEKEAVIGPVVAAVVVRKIMLVAVAASIADTASWQVLAVDAWSMVVKMVV